MRPQPTRSSLEESIRLQGVNALSSKSDRGGASSFALADLPRLLPSCSEGKDLNFLCGGSAARGSAGGCWFTGIGVQAASRAQIQQRCSSACCYGTAAAMLLSSLLACNPVKAHSINTASTTLKQDCGLVEELITIILLNAAIRRMRPQNT